MVEFDNLY